MTEKKFQVGYIYSKPSYLDRAIIKALEKKFDVIRLPFTGLINLESIKEKTKNCKVILNYSVSSDEIFGAAEFSKALEKLGKKVINSTYSFFYQEDKWMFYLKCLEHELPTPRTYLISRGTNGCSKFIKDFLKKDKMILKAIFSDNGTCVEKVNNYNMFQNKVRRIIKNNPISPIVAQEYIPNSNRCYRVTLINHNVEQAVVKIGKSWKQTGNERKERFRTIKLDEDLRQLCEKTSKALEMDICGLDLVFNDGKWYIIEANSCPTLNFINKDLPILTEKLTDYLYALCKKEDNIQL